MGGVSALIPWLGGGLVVAIFGIAAVLDWKTREAPDWLWQILAIGGIVIGAAVVAPGGELGWAMWALVGAFALEHLFPWDSALEKSHPELPILIEIATYVAVCAIVVGAVVRWGVGTSGVPPTVLAALAAVLIGRGLFEAGLLYGGADAKAFISAGVALPIQAAPVVGLSSSAALALTIFPFPLTVLMDAALLSLVVPIAIAIRNARRGEFSLSKGFVAYTIPVGALPERFVWVKDSRLPPPEEEAETSEEDRLQRVSARDRLLAMNVERVWVSPQLPFLVLLLAGAVLALLAGNLLFDLFGLL